MNRNTPDQSGKVLATVALMMLASALVAGASLLAKALGTGALGPALHPLQITAGRYGFALLLLVLFALFRRPDFSRPRVPLHVARVFCGWLGITCMFAAATLIPLADATAISFLNPMFAMLIAIPLLGERVGPVRWTAAILSFAGALLLIRPGSATFHPAALIALLSAVVIGLEVNFVKLLSRREGSFQILLFSNGLGSVFAVATALFVWVSPVPEQWLALSAIGLLMVATQAIFVFVLKRGDASFVTPLFYATLIFAAFYDLLIFGVIPPLLSLLGITIIITGASLLAFSEVRRRRVAGMG